MLPSHVRSYVLHPYKLCKDLRTGVQTEDVEGVLNGDLDQFIKAALALKVHTWHHRRHSDPVPETMSIDKAK
jgi:hypothetical protein